jgi:hypothetical protein
VHLSSQRGGLLTEPDVTLTDYGLSVLCSWCTWSYLQKAHSRQFRALWTLFFGSIAVASLTGGTVHGFFLDQSTFGYRILWPTTLIAIGVTAASAWILTGISISHSMDSIKRWTFFAVMNFLLYSTLVLFLSRQDFTVVILNYLPPMLALLIVNIRDYARTSSTPYLFVIGGILVIFAAAFIQQAGLALHRAYFNHNSTYHLVQAIGLLILFQGAKGLTGAETIVR